VRDAGPVKGIEAVLVLVWPIVFGAFVVWVFRRKARKKREVQEAYAELRTFVEGRGWGFEEVVPGLVDAYEGAVPLPITAKGIPGDNVVSGSYRGFGFRAFEHRQYHRDLDDGSTSVTVHSFWALHLGVEVPDLRVYRDGWLDTVLRGRAMEVGIPQLDKDFHIVSKDEERAWRVLDGGLADFLLSDPRASIFGLRLHDGQLITWRPEGLRSDAFDEPLDYLADAAGHLGTTTQARQTP
jgi:hypothetical protein